MKSTIKLRKILEQCDCTFTLNEEQQFVVYLSDVHGELIAEVKGKTFSVAVGNAYQWLEAQKKKAKNQL